jgi:hypothetical protein
MGYSYPKGRAHPDNAKARKHGLATLRRTLQELTDRGINSRAEAARMLAEWSAEMLRDLDGPNLSAMEMEVFHIARLRKLVVDSISGWIVKQLDQQGLVLAETKTLLPIVKEWSNLLEAYTRNLETLGLRKRVRESPSLAEYIASKSTPVSQANVDTPDEQDNPPGEGSSEGNERRRGS